MRTHQHALALAIALVGCTSATLDASWRSPHAPELTSVVTIAAAPDGAIRRNLEDQMAAQLSRHGVHAVPAYAVLTAQDLADRDRFVAAARAKGFDGLVGMRLIDAHQEIDYASGFDAYWHGSWGNATPDTVVRVQVTAYSLETRKSVWSAVSKSIDPDSANVLVGDVTRVAGDKLARDRVVGAPQAASR